MSEIENIDIFKEKISDITDSLSAIVQVGKIAQKIADISEAAKSKKYELPTIIAHGALANLERTKHAKSHMHEWLVETFGSKIAEQTLEIARLSNQLDTFIYQQAAAIITPLDLENRRPAFEAEKALKATLIEIGGVGEKQAGEVVRRCKSHITAALQETVRAI